MAPKNAKTSAPAVVATPAPVAVTPAVTETKKVVRAPKKETTSAPVVESAPALPVVVADAEQTDSTSTTQTREDRQKSALALIDDQISALKKLRAQLVANFKHDGQDLKAAQKAGGRRRRAPASTEDGHKKAPSGIVKPTNVSDDMCKFMGVAPGTLLARTEVTRFITQYIKQHNLQDQEHKRHINPDAKLKSLLSIPEGETLTFFNLQRFMKGHFPKAGEAVKA